jgi:zinc transport system substrate-binding protein
MSKAHFPAIALCLFGVSVQAEVPTVVTDIPPVHSLVAQVMGDLGDPTLLLDQGADLHSFQLRPSQASALAGADIIFWIGPELTPWLTRAQSIVPDAASVALIDTTGTIHRNFEEPGAHDHHTTPSQTDLEADQAASDSGISDGHREHEALDPHAWLDPDNAIIWLGRIADELSALDPGNSVSYRANASLGQAAITALDADLQLILEKTKDVPIVVAHDALGYFAGHFGLKIAATIAEGDAADPGAARLSNLRHMLETGAVACIFPEVSGDLPRVATLAEKTDVSIGAALDPEGRALMPGPSLYATLLTNLANSISDCVAAR